MSADPSSQAHGDDDEPVEIREGRGLGRLRLDAEPLEVQLNRHREAFHVLAGVTTAIAAAFLALFASFDRPGVGLVVATLLWLPIVGFAWRDHVRLGREVAAYQAEQANPRRNEAG